MEVHQLRYFCAVARAGNFTRAAAHEHVAQPALSQQIQKMEQELGAKLFDRLGRGVRLTAFGQAFLPRAQAILRELGECLCNEPNCHWIGDAALAWTVIVQHVAGPMPAVS